MFSIIRIVVSQSLSCYKLKRYFFSFGLSHIKTFYSETCLNSILFLGTPCTRVFEKVTLSVERGAKYYRIVCYKDHNRKLCGVLHLICTSKLFQIIISNDLNKFEFIDPVIFILEVYRGLDHEIYVWLNVNLVIQATINFQNKFEVVSISTQIP